MTCNAETFAIQNGFANKFGVRERRHKKLILYFDCDRILISFDAACCMLSQIDLNLVGQHLGNLYTFFVVFVNSI